MGGACRFVKFLSAAAGQLQHARRVFKLLLVFYNSCQREAVKLFLATMARIDCVASDCQQALCRNSELEFFKLSNFKIDF